MPFPLRQRRMRLFHAATLVVLAIGLASCTSLERPGAGDTTQIAPVVPGDGEAARCLPDAVDCDDTPAGDAMVPEEISITTALPSGTTAAEMAPGSVADAWPVFLQEAVVDGADLTVSFSGGEAPCFVVDHVEVDETPERVIVSVLVGVPDPSADCSQQETSIQSVSVQLDEPLGDRPLKDGSRTVPDDAQA